MGNVPTGYGCADCKQCETECGQRVGWVDASDEYYANSGETLSRPNLVKHLPALSDDLQSREQEGQWDQLEERKQWKLDEDKDMGSCGGCEAEPEPSPEPLPEFKFDLHAAAKALKLGSTSEWKQNPVQATAELMVGSNMTARLPSPQGSTVSRRTDCQAQLASPVSLRNSASAPQLSLPVSHSGSTLAFDELSLEYMFFNPCVEPLKTQLLQKMGVHQNSNVEAIRGRVGGCNAGMWVLRDPFSSQCFMLKLVRVLPAWVGPSRSPESEKYANLSREHPEMVNDASLSFPCKVFHCLGKGGSKSHDLIVMRWVSGVRFSEFIMQKLHGGHVEDLMRALHWFGYFLADFHERYNGLQHGDLTPANVFVDEQSNKFILVDVADIAPRNPVIQSDVERFVSGLDLLSNFYGEDLWMKGKVRFETGYNSRRSGQCA